MRLKCDGTRAETRFRFSAKRTSPFKSAGVSVQSTTGSRGVRISVSNTGYTTFRGSVKSTGYPLHSPVSPSLPLPCVTVCHQVSNALYIGTTLAVFLYLSSFRANLVNLHTRHFSVTNFSDPETYENGVSSSGLILALFRISSKSVSHDCSYRYDCLVCYVQVGHNMCFCNEI